MDYNRRLKEADLKDREIAQKEKLSKIEEQDQRNAFFTMAIKDYPEMPAPLKAYMFTQVHGRYPKPEGILTLRKRSLIILLKNTRVWLKIWITIQRRREKKQKHM